MSSATLIKDFLSWEEDYATRVNPALITELMHQCVPVLKHAGWQVTVVDYGFAETTLPLISATTNQHGTHQGALIALAGEYTGGMAITSLLRGVPMAGIHKCASSEAASLWLAAMAVKYHAPSTGHLIGRCRISKEDRDLIVSRYSQGKRVIVTLPVEMMSNGQLVAEAQMTYFCQPACQLLEPGKKTSTLFNQKIKASARMIAGVRSRFHFSENGRTFRVDSAHTATAAGPQGSMLADRLNQALPQLVDMVHARTIHADQLIRSVPGLKQVVLAGAGLDMRPLQLQKEYPDVKFFELDLPEMLVERNRVFDLIPGADRVLRHPVACDFLKDDVADVLLANGFDPQMPTAIVYEGCSMYFPREVNEKILKSFARLLVNIASRLWVDFVSQSVIDGQTDIPEVIDFLKKMDELGEAFVFGSNAPSSFVAECGLESLVTISVREFQRVHGQPSQDPVLDQYAFSISKRAHESFQVLGNDQGFPC